MLTKAYLDNLHLLHDWQVVAVLFYNAKIVKEKIHYKSYKVLLPKDITHFPTYQDSDLWDILFNQSHFLSWKKFKLKNHQISLDQIEHLKDTYRKHVSNLIKDFNSRSCKQMQFIGQIDKFPHPRIARFLPVKDIKGEVVMVAKHIETAQESLLASAYWEKNYKVSIDQYIETRICIAHTLPDDERDALLGAGRAIRDRITNNGILDLNSVFPNPAQKQLIELKKAS